MTAAVSEELSGPVFEESHAVASTRKDGKSHFRIARICTALRSKDGSALVEMAVTLPIMLMIMTGIFSFSVALYQKMQLVEAVSNGGRVLAVSRGDSDPCKTTATAVYAAAPYLSQSKMTLSFVLNGVSQSGATCKGATLGNAGGTAQLTASYPCNINIYGYSLPSCRVTSQITENVQ